MQENVLRGLKRTCRRTEETVYDDMEAILEKIRPSATTLSSSDSCDPETSEQYYRSGRVQVCVCDRIAARLGGKWTERRRGRGAA